MCYHIDYAFDFKNPASVFVWEGNGKIIKIIENKGNHVEALEDPQTYFENHRVANLST